MQNKEDANAPNANNEQYSCAVRFISSNPSPSALSILKQRANLTTETADSCFLLSAAEAMIVVPPSSGSRGSENSLAVFEAPTNCFLEILQAGSA